MDRVDAIKQRLEEITHHVSSEARMHVHLAIQQLSQPKPLQLRNIAAAIVALDSAAQAEKQQELKQYLSQLGQHLGHALS